MRPLISRPTALRSRHLWEVATALLLMRNKVTAKGHVGVRKTQCWKKKKQCWCWKNWEVNRDAEVSHDAADRRCEAAAGGGGDDAPVKIINHAWHRRSRLARQRGVGGLSPANHTRLGVVERAIANLSIHGVDGGAADGKTTPSEPLFSEI